MAVILRVTLVLPAAGTRYRAGDGAGIVDRLLSHAATPPVGFVAVIRSPGTVDRHHSDAEGQETPVRVSRNRSPRRSSCQCRQSGQSRRKTVDPPYATQSDAETHEIPARDSPGSISAVCHIAELSPGFVEALIRTPSRSHPPRHTATSSRTTPQPPRSAWHTAVDHLTPSAHPGERARRPARPIHRPGAMPRSCAPP